MIKKLCTPKFTKRYLSAAPFALLLFFGLTQFAQASVASWVGSAFGNISYYFIGKLAFGISYLIAWIAGVAISIEAWLVGVMLGINTGVFQSQIVQKGFGVTLSIANLGFVIGIIVIAIATILHVESYGYKKMLWKLVVAAILVNFSLVIAAPLFALGNSFTQYFLNCIDPSVGCGGATGATAFTSMNDFAKNLAGSFNPQVGLIGNPSNSFSGVSPSVSLGSSFGQMLVPIISIGFVAFDLVAIAIVLAALVIMLLIRYIYIAILAILMPFAWLGWVFPNIKDWWSKWWHEFIRWTFFAPIVVFFLYLAMQTEQSMANGTAIANQSFGTYTSNSNAIWAPISNLFTNIFTPVISQLLSSLLLIGLSIAGLIVADKMSITGAGAAVKTMQGVGKSVQGFVGKQGKKAARATYQKAGGQKLTDRLQEGRIGALRYIPGTRRLASLAGRGISKIDSNKALVDEAKKKVPEDLKEVRRNLKGSMNTEDRFAHIAKLVERGDLKANDMVGDQKVSEFLDKNLDLVARYAQIKMVGDADKSMGSNKAMRDAEKQIDILKKNNASETNLATATNDLDKATKEFVEKMEKGDAAKMNVNEIFGENATSESSKSLARRFALSAPQVINGMLPKMKAKNLDAFNKMYEKLLDDEIATTNDSEAREKLQKAKKSYTESFNRNAMGGGGEEHNEAHTPATPTAGAAAPTPRPSRPSGSGGSNAPRPAAVPSTPPSGDGGGHH